jgi:hypothetical protein
MSTVPLQSLDEIRRVIGDAPVYVSFDIDVLDRAFAPGTAHLKGGLASWQAQAIIAAAAQAAINRNELGRGKSGLRCCGDHRARRRDDGLGIFLFAWRSRDLVAV